MKHSRPPDLKSSSNVSIPFAWITGPATDPPPLYSDRGVPRENQHRLWKPTASLQYCLPSHVCLLGGTKSSLGMTSRHHEAVNKQEKELVHYYWELPRQKPTSFGGIKHGRGANWLFQINESFLLNIDGICKTTSSGLFFGAFHLHSTYFKF